jgi:Raf kinase inhibitor-like YbhB/YbcL family protein
MAMVSAFTLTSPSFTHENDIPVEHTCDGADTPPALEVSVAPEGSRSFALIMDDPDAPGGTFTHWLAYDIPAGAGRLGVQSGNSLKNSFGRAGYGGPCPPRGHGPHRYYIKVYAVDVPSLGLKGRSRDDLEDALRDHTLAMATLMGRYERRG